MAISYTDNFSFPLLDTGSDGWAAVMNGMLVDVDKLLAEASDPLIWDENTAGQIHDSEVLIFDGDVLGWA